MTDIKYIINFKNDNSGGTDVRWLAPEKIKKVQAFHRKFPQYSVTPLANLKNLACKLNLKSIYVKDESKRFGLNAFKVLGGAYAIGKILSDRLIEDIDEISIDNLKFERTKKRIGQITFTTATDGNHGRGIAWAASELGHKAVIYMPKGTAKRRLDAVLETGAEAYITDLNYDDAVRLAAENAQKYGWEIVQDTAWEGYEEIPKWIMQGYGVIAQEIQDKLNADGVDKPTHIILQAGVGSFAGAILGYYVAAFGDNKPITIIVEPQNAACIYKSALINDGKPKRVDGDLNTIMAGLACGEPNPIGWNILRDYAYAYFACPDYVAERGMRLLANPISGDEKIVSGESGAVGLGLLSILMTDNLYKDLSQKLKLDNNSKVLIISTEGDTDPENYKKIVMG